MRRIEEWLGDLGLAEYALSFVKNHIDFEILGDLSDQDFERIGVAALCHRAKLLRAISELNALSAEKPRVRRRQRPRRKRRTAPPAPEPLAGGDVTGERRYVTVLFCDMVDALEGFLPTPEFLEIAEAQTLFMALAS